VCANSALHAISHEPMTDLDDVSIRLARRESDPGNDPVDHLLSDNVFALARQKEAEHASMTNSIGAGANVQASVMPVDNASRNP
jgi:hypothetical protein